MHRSLSAAVLAATIALWNCPALADAPEALSQARKLLGQNDARGAAALLEDALPQASTDRAAVLELLRQAYESAALQAEAEGKPREAEAFRDNLEILNRKPTKTPAPVSPHPAPAPEPTAANPPKTAAPPAVEQVPRAEPGPAPTQEPAPAPSSEAPQAKAVAAPPAGPAESTAADAAYQAKQYEEAGRLYAALDRDGKLPPARLEHWVYCRQVAIIRRINAKPTTDEEWGSIEDEIGKIRKLSPKNWFNEYLHRVVVERSNGASRRSGKANKVVVRGAAPDESPPDLLAMTDPESARKPLLAVGPRAAAEPQPAGAPEPAPVAEPARPVPTPGKWLIHETANFRILHADDELAAKVAAVAEAARSAETKRWSGAPPTETWSPKCDIYLYPTAPVFSRMTGQPEDSPGFSTMGMNGGRIIARRVNLRADHPNMVKAILPHEVTHVVLADLFPRQQIPRWADEGMAVLAEPAIEQRFRAADLDEPLTTGKLFRVEDLMKMDYPTGRYWSLYYAQSVSLTRFLVEQGTPDQFVKFVQGAQNNGTEAELKRVYNIDGFTDLHTRWITYAKTQSREATAKANTSDTTRRE